MWRGTIKVDLLTLISYLYKTMAVHRKNKALRRFAVYIFIVCLLQGACEPNGAVGDPESNLIDPDKFVLEITEDERATNNNIVVVKITPGCPDMNVGDFLITASIVDNKGIVKGAANKQGSKGPAYTADLNGCSVATLAHRILKVKKDSQGKPITFRAQVMLGASIKQYDQYTLTVKVQRKGNHPHIATQSIVLTAKKKGADTKEPTAEASTTATNSQTLATTLGTGSSNATPLPSSLSILKEASSILTEKETTQETNPSTLIPDTNLPEMPNREVQQPISPASTVCTSNHPSSSSLTESSQQPASKQFTVRLRDATQRNHVRNFVLVIIQPDSSGIKLQELAITAHVENNLGVVRGSSEKNSGGFVYDKVLNHCNLEELFLTNQQSNCLGEHDAFFAQGGEVAFRIEVEPGTTVRPGDPYTLTVEVAYTGSTPHVATKSTPLTATHKASPFKRKQNTSPREK